MRLAAALTTSIAARGAGAATTGSEPAPTYRASDFADGNALSILPPGENGLVNPAQAAAFETTGQRPPASQDQKRPTFQQVVEFPRHRPR